jgi:hypothetical protein
MRTYAHGLHPNVHSCVLKSFAGFACEHAAPYADLQTGWAQQYTYEHIDRSGSRVTRTCKACIGMFRPLNSWWWCCSRLHNSHLSRSCQAVHLRQPAGQCAQPTTPCDVTAVPLQMAARLVPASCYRTCALGDCIRALQVSMPLGRPLLVRVSIPQLRRQLCAGLAFACHFSI